MENADFNTDGALTYTGRKKTYTHHSVQDEMLKLYGDATLRCILERAHKSKTFAVIVYGTQDINRTEQESISIRYVSDELEPCEDFVGFYAVEGTTGNYKLATCIKDCLIRLQLPIENLRGQTYDGASNMSGNYNGCQATLGREQPLPAPLPVNEDNSVAAVRSEKPLRRVRTRSQGVQTIHRHSRIVPLMSVRCQRPQRGLLGQVPGSLEWARHYCGELLEQTRRR